MNKPGSCWRRAWRWLMGSILFWATMGPGVTGARGAAEAIPRRGEVYLFTFFRDNGQDGLYLAWSRDGLDWTEIAPPGKSFLQPLVGTRLMRDPCLRQDDNGKFHMVWTTGWNDRVIGYASSDDLRHWSEQRELPVMTHEPSARNAWAPELFFDSRTAILRGDANAVLRSRLDHSQPCPWVGAEENQTCALRFRGYEDRRPVLPGGGG